MAYDFSAPRLIADCHPSKQGQRYFSLFFPTAEGYKYIFCYSKMSGLMNPRYAWGRYGPFPGLDQALEHFRKNCPEPERYRLEEGKENSSCVAEIIKGKYKKASLNWTPLEKEEGFPS